MSEFFQAGMGPSTERDENAFTTYADLGKHIKRQNLSITLPDDKVGRWAANSGKFDYTVLEQTAGLLLEPLAEVGDLISNTSREVVKGIPDASRAFLGSSLLTDTPRQLGSGITSGASLGLGGALSKAIEPTRHAKDAGTFAYGVGEVIGEVAGPYKVAAGLFGNKIRKAGASAWGAADLGTSRLLPRMLAGATESAVVEGGKASLQQEGDVISSAADGFITGGVSEGVVGGAMKAGREGLEWLIKPRKGEEVATETIEWLVSKDMPVPPTVARPYSNTMNLMQQKASKSAAAIAIVKSIRGDLSEGLAKAKQQFITAVGNNVAIKSPLEAGRALYHRVTDVSVELRSKMRTNYDEIAASEIGSKVQIDPNMEYKPIRDGVPDENPTDLWQAFRKALGKHANKKPKNQPAPIKVLHNLFQEVRADHKTVDLTVSESTVPGKMVTQPRKTAPASSTIINRGHQRSHLNPNQRFSPAAGQHTGVGPDDYQSLWKTESGGGSTFERTEVQLPLKTYDYWWDVIKQIGDQMDTPAYRKNKTVKRVVDSAYHAIQDAIDYQAIKFDETFGQRIKHARESAKVSFGYDESLLVRKVLDAPNKFRSEEMIDVLFANTESVQAAKRMLGPDDYDIARQAWLRTVLNRTAEMGEEVAEDRPAFKNLWQEIARRAGGTMDSEFIDEVFNENNFVSMYKGTPLNVTTMGAEKRALMQEFWDQFRNVDSMLSQLHGGADEFGGAGVERGGLGSFVNTESIAASFGKTKQLAFQLLATTRLGKEYFKPNPNENYFIFKKIPEWEGGIQVPEIIQEAARRMPGMSGIPSQVGTSTRQAATSAALNRLNPRD